MQSAKLLVLLFGLFILPHITHAQSAEVPVRIAFIREYSDDTPTGVFLLEDGEERLISGDYQFNYLELLGLAWSPTCDRLIFSATPNGADVETVQELILADLESGELTQLTSNLGITLGTFWSPVDDRIAFRAYDTESNTTGFFVGAIDDRDFTEFYAGGVGSAIADWSTDGNILFVSARSGQIDSLIAIDLKSPNYDQSIIFEGAEATPVYRPDSAYDGRQLIFATGNYGESDIFLLDTVTLELTNLTNTPGNYYSVSWSPSYDQIAYTLGEDIYIMNADGSNQTNLTSLFDDQFFTDRTRLIGWSTDGQYILYTSVSTPDSPNLELVAIAADGSDRIQLTTTTDPNVEYTLWYPCMLPIEESN